MKIFEIIFCNVYFFFEIGYSHPEFSFKRKYSKNKKRVLTLKIELLQDIQLFFCLKFQKNRISFNSTGRYTNFNSFNYLLEITSLDIGFYNRTYLIFYE